MSVSHFRRAALALPGAAEGAHQRTADFRVGKRIFATLGYPDDAWGMVKLTQEQQSMLVEAEPDIFRPVPGGWGKQGYTNVRLAKADATTLKSALTMAWKNVAPKSQVKARDQGSTRDTRSLDFAPHQFAIPRLCCYPLLNPIVPYLRNSGQLPHGTLRARFLSVVPPFSPACRTFTACSSYRSVARS